MKVYKNEDVENVNLFESALVGISFNHHATVIEFKVSWLEGYEDEVIDVICNNCSDIDFAFKHEGDQLGELTITGFSYLKINMMDVVKKSGDKIDTSALAKELVCKVVEISALKEIGRASCRERV